MIEPLEFVSAMIAEERSWQPISSAPHDRDVELAVINREGTHALVFPCRRIPTGWIKSNTKEKVEISPTHWRDWTNLNT